MSELARALSKAETIEPYNPTLRDRARYWLTDKFGASVGDRLAGTNLPHTPLGGVMDMVPGVGTAMGVEEGVRAAGQGRPVEAALGIGGGLVDAIPVIGAVAGSPAARRALGNFAADQSGAVQLDLPLGEMFARAAKPEYPDVVQGMADLIDRDFADKITPEMFEEARKRFPKELDAMLMAREPMQFVSQADTVAPLGMGERVYHYSKAGRDFPYFNPDVPLMNLSPGSHPGQEFDILGPHVGTFDAANDRRLNFTGAVNYDDGTLPEGYVPDMHPHASERVVVPDIGQMMELSADMSQPFNPQAAHEYLGQLLENPDLTPQQRVRLEGTRDRIERKFYELSGWEDDAPKVWRDRWNEDTFNMVLRDLAEMEIHGPRAEGVAAYEHIPTGIQNTRRALAEAGYTNVPYRNAIEDMGSTSHVMLTDRPKGSKAVLRKRQARFSPHLKHLPNLMAGAAGAAIISDEDIRNSP